MLTTRTKIVCTIGPASQDPAMLVKLMDEGMRMARQNFSHGTHTEHSEMYKRIREASKKTDKVVAILADLQGPKIRLGIMPDAGVDLKSNQNIIFSTPVK